MSTEINCDQCLLSLSSSSSSSLGRLEARTDSALGSLAPLEASPLALSFQGRGESLLESLSEAPARLSFRLRVDSQLESVAILKRK